MGWGEGGPEAVTPPPPKEIFKKERFQAKNWRNSGKNKSHEYFFKHNLFFWMIILLISEMNIIDFSRSFIKSQTSGT